MSDHFSLADRLKSDTIVVAPGIYGALGAIQLAQAGFEAAYLSGASIAYSRFGRPDIGLVAMSEVAATISAIHERTDLPLIVDGDTGFGNALNVMRTVRLFQQCGATAIQLEDQTLPKRCGHLAGKSLIDAAEMTGKIKAALDARRSADTAIIARTDSIAVDGFEAALARGERYLEAGADVLFIEAPQTSRQIAEIAKQFGGRIPLMANMVEGGRTPEIDAGELEAIGYSIVIFPGGLVRAVTHTMRDYFASLHVHGTTRPFRDRMLDFTELNTVLETDAMLALGARYDRSKFGDDDA